VRRYAAYVREGRAPVLIADGFSFWAFLFGPLWLFAVTAWIPGILVLALDVFLRVALHGPAQTILGFAVAWLVGLFGRDMHGWSLSRRGWRLAHVVAGRGEDAAYARLLTARPELQAAAAA
jgi:hypothetical protein